MIAGRLSYRLEAFAPETAETASGAERVSYSPRGWLWADRARVSGREARENGELFGGASSSWRVRDAHPVRRGWRLRDGADLWEVSRVEPNRRKGMLTLHCELVNE